MANAVDQALQQAGQAIDTSGIGKQTMSGLSLGMSIAQRQAEIEKSRQDLKFQQDQHEIQKHDWLHNSITTAASENDPKLKAALFDDIEESFPKMFNGKRLTPGVVDLWKKSPTFTEQTLAMGELQAAVAANKPDMLSDINRKFLNELTSGQLTALVSGQAKLAGDKNSIIAALTKAGVATDKTAEMAGTEKGTLQEQLNKNRPGNARIENTQAMNAERSVNKDAPLNSYKLRLEGALKVNDLLKDAKEGKIKTNKSFLGFLNAETARLELGSQAPGLQAAEKTEIMSAATKFEGFKEMITGKPEDSVSPDFIKQVSGEIRSMVDSNQHAIHGRYATLRAGTTPAERKIIEDKWKEDISHFGSRFGRWVPGSIKPVDGSQAEQQPQAPGISPATGEPEKPKITNDEEEQNRQSLKGHLQQIRSAPAGTYTKEKQAEQEKQAIDRYELHFKKKFVE